MKFTYLELGNVCVADAVRDNNLRSSNSRLHDNYSTALKACLHLKWDILVYKCAELL